MTLSRPTRARPALRGPLLGISLLALAACEPGGTFDADLRHFGGSGLDTTAAVNQATATRCPEAATAGPFTGHPLSCQPSA